MILSLFPGLGLLDRPFEDAGFVVVRGPDVLWGGDVRRFTPERGAFDGVIGGPPCQEWSQLSHLVRANGYEARFGNLIPEYERVVREAAPRWWLMENVRLAPRPAVPGYDSWGLLIRDQDVGGRTPRERALTFGLRAGLWDSLASPWALLHYEPRRAAGQSVVGDDRAVPVAVGGSGKRKPGASSGTRRDLGDLLETMGFDRDLLDDAPFTLKAARRMVGNGVPYPMGAALARFVLDVLNGDQVTTNPEEYRA